VSPEQGTSCAGFTAPCEHSSSSERRTAGAVLGASTFMTSPAAKRDAHALRSGDVQAPFGTLTRHAQDHAAVPPHRRLMLACGRDNGSTTTASSSWSAATPPTGTREDSGALAADARSAATGDIPDSQSFLTFKPPRPRISMLYAEGWAAREARTAHRSYNAGFSPADDSRLGRTRARSYGRRGTCAADTRQPPALRRIEPKEYRWLCRGPRS
jgi:hypothetical protein